MKTSNRILQALTTCVLLAASVSVSVAQQTTRERIVGKAAVTTDTLQGTVEHVEGNYLVVRMANGKVLVFDPPASRRFVIDGKELTVRDLKPGMKLKAVVVTTSTPITDRTTTVGTAKVFWVSGKTVVLTLPNNEHKTYTVRDDYKFIVEGKPTDVSSLRPGMTVSAEKIVEEPSVEIASDTTVTGQAK